MLRLFLSAMSYRCLDENIYTLSHLTYVSFGGAKLNSKQARETQNKVAT